MKNKIPIINNQYTNGSFGSRSRIVQPGWKGIVIALLVSSGAVITSIPFIHTTRATEPEVERPVFMVQTAAINPVKQYTLKRTFLGRVEAARNTDLGFELAGKISGIQFDEGDQVVKGQILAHQDTDRLQARRAELVAALNQSRANLKLAELTYQRYKKVVKSSGVSYQQLDEAKEHFRATQSAVELARSRIKTIDVEIEKSQIEAPFDANITQRNVDEGAVVAAGTPILQLQENQVTEIRVGIAGKIVESIRVGQMLPIIINDAALRAAVKAVVPLRDGRTRTVDVILSLTELPTHVRSGDLVRVELGMTIDQSGFWVPLSALSEEARGLWSIYTLEVESGSGSDSSMHKTVQRRTIEIIHTEADRVFAQGFFEKDDRFVTNGVQRIVPGQRVQISTSMAYLDTNKIDTGLEYSHEHR